MVKTVDEIVEKYPKIFPANRRRLGIGVGDGWLPIIDNMCALIQWHIDQTRKQRCYTLQHNRKQRELPEESREFRVAREACSQVYAVQIKEKFGTLRFYYDGGDDVVDGIVQMGEQMTNITCEECGNKGGRGGSGWIRTLCAPCNEQSNKVE